MFEAIDIYCERTDASFWSEPLNAISNAAFLLAAFAAWRIARREDRLDWASWTLIALMAIIGIGSFLFHTFANRWSMLADVIPIGLAILAYLYLIAVRFYRWPVWAGFATIAFSLGVIYVLGAGLAAVVGPLNGSTGYAAVGLTMLGLGLGLHLLGHPAGKGIAIGIGIFAVSLTFRSVDMEVCATVPTGAHYFWHALNGLVLFWLTRVLILHGARPSSTA